MFCPFLSKLKKTTQKEIYLAYRPVLASLACMYRTQLDAPLAYRPVLVSLACMYRTQLDAAS